MSTKPYTDLMASSALVIEWADTFNTDAGMVATRKNIQLYKNNEFMLEISINKQFHHYVNLLINYLQATSTLLQKSPDTLDCQ